MNFIIQSISNFILGLLFCVFSGYIQPFSQTHLLKSSTKHTFSIIEHKTWIDPETDSDATDDDSTIIFC